MSRSQPRLTSPVTRVFEWGGAAGELTFYNREANERQIVQLPFHFLVLDQLASIGGFSERANQRIWSNEVRPEQLKTSPFVVRTKGEILHEGLYKDFSSKEANYVASIYIAYYNDNGELAIGKIAAAGSARGAWFDFRKTIPNVEDGKVSITGKGELVVKNKMVQWYPPAFAWSHSSKEEDEIALRLDRTLQQYLETYFKASRAEREEDLMVPAGTDMHATTDDMPPPPEDADFDNLLNQPPPTDINPEDLPFSPRRGE
jgi:hypothetical protein